MKETLILVGLVIGLVAFMGHRDSVFQEGCRSRGGTPVIGTQNRICYAQGLAIDVN